jgi:hypothetical protein
MPALRIQWPEDQARNRAKKAMMRARLKRRFSADVPVSAGAFD